MTRLILHTHNELIDCLIVFINVCLHSQSISLISTISWIIKTINTHFLSRVCEWACVWACLSVCVCTAYAHSQKSYESFTSSVTKQL